MQYLEDFPAARLVSLSRLQYMENTYRMGSPFDSVQLPKRKVAKHGRYNELVTGRYNEYHGL